MNRKHKLIRPSMDDKKPLRSSICLESIEEPAHLLGVLQLHSCNQRGTACRNTSRFALAFLSRSSAARRASSALSWGFFSSCHTSFTCRRSRRVPRSAMFGLRQSDDTDEEKLRAAEANEQGTRLL